MKAVACMRPLQAHTQGSGVMCRRTLEKRERCGPTSATAVNTRNGHHSGSLVEKVYQSDRNRI